jgi:hypothetical protein
MPKYEHFIKKKHEVQDEDKAATFKAGCGPESKPRNVVLCGLEGSGREALAQEVAGRFGMEVVHPDPTGGADDLARLAEPEGRVLVVGAAHLEAPEAVYRIPGLGRVFFLMADVPFLAESLQLPEGEPREKLAAAFPDLEMRFHALGGFPLSAYRPVEENAAQIVEVLEMCA